MAGRAELLVVAKRLSVGGFDRFARDVRARDPNWQLTATQAER